MTKILIRLSIATLMTAHLAACGSLYGAATGVATQNFDDYKNYQDYKNGNTQKETPAASTVPAASAPQSGGGGNAGSNSSNDMNLNLSEADVLNINMGDDSILRTDGCGRAVSINKGNNSQVYSDGSKCK